MFFACSFCYLFLLITFMRRYRNRRRIIYKLYFTLPSRIQPNTTLVMDNVMSSTRWMQMNYTRRPLAEAPPLTARRDQEDEHQEEEEQEEEELENMRGLWSPDIHSLHQFEVATPTLGPRNQQNVLLPIEHPHGMASLQYHLEQENMSETSSESTASMPDLINDFESNDPAEFDENMNGNDNLVWFELLSPHRNLSAALLNVAFMQDSPLLMESRYDYELNNVMNQSLRELEVRNKKLDPNLLPHVLRTGSYQGVENKYAKNERCPILQEEFHNETPVAEMPCGHVFCEEAIKTWLTCHCNSCPVCRWSMNTALYTNSIVQMNDTNTAYISYIDPSNNQTF